MEWLGTLLHWQHLPQSNAEPSSQQSSPQKRYQISPDMCKAYGMSWITARCMSGPTHNTRQMQACDTEANTDCQSRTVLCCSRGVDCCRCRSFEGRLCCRHATTTTKHLSPTSFPNKSHSTPAETGYVMHGVTAEPAALSLTKRKSRTCTWLHPNPQAQTPAAEGQRIIEHLCAQGAHALASIHSSILPCHN